MTRAWRCASRVNRIGLVLLASTCVGLTLSPSAGAQVVTLSADSETYWPDAAVDDDGTAHVVWVAGSGQEEDVVYCRVPRGAGACATTRAFGLTGVADRPTINLMATGELVITSERFADDPAHGDAHNKIYAIRSGDGGLSFDPPIVIGNRADTIWGWGGEVEPGPGNFSVSAIGNDGGCNQGLNYSALPLAGMTSTAAELTDACAKAYDPSLAFLDPTTPLAAYSDLDQIFYRRWSGVGDHNLLSSWEGERSFGDGEEPRLAGGPRGAFLLFRNNDFPRRYRVRPYDRDADLFPASKEKVVSASHDGSPIFRDFVQDAGGTLHAVFLERPDGGGEYRLVRRYSPDGALSWLPKSGPKVLAEQTATRSFFNLRAAAAPDGGGVVVADSNGGGPIHMVTMGVTGGAGACPAQVKVGGALVRAREGCFAKAKGGRRVATGPVKVHGVDIDPAAGAAAAAAFKVTVRPKDRTLKTNKQAVVRAGAVTLDRSKLAWRMPKGTGKVKRIGAADKSVFNQIDKFQKQLFDFPLVGDAELEIGTGEQATVPINFQLPGVLGQATGAADLDTTSAGFDPDGLEISVPQAQIGLLKISNIHVTYSGADTFTGSASLSLPPAYGQSFTVGFGFKDGRFNFLHYDMPFSPMLPIVAPPVVGAPPEPLIGLESLAIDYVDEEGSRTFKGTVDLVGGGKYIGLRAAALEGNVTLSFPASGPATISAGGDLSVVELPFANGKIAYSTDGLLTFDGAVEFPKGFTVIEAVVEGWVSVASPIRFSAYGAAEIFGHEGGKGVVSSKGVAGCVNINPDPTGLSPPVYIGFGYAWGGSISFVCSVGSFKLAKPAAAPAGSARAANSASVQIPGGLPQAALEITGEGDAPRVSVSGPDGAGITSAEGLELANGYAAYEDPETEKTFVTIGKPAAGAYSVETEPGSAEIAEVRLARGLPQPKLKFKLSGKGRKRTLRYSLRKIAGQKVTLAEQSGSGLYREFATLKGAKGKLGFRPKNARVRQRRLIALVEQDGLPRDRLDLARFKAPAYRPPAKPKRVRARRKGSKLLVKWKRVAGARSYRAAINLPRDGRKLLRFTGRKKTKLTIGGLEPNDKAKVAVAAIGADARPGRSAKAKLKAKKKKKRKKRR